jgi:gluconolactonase
VDALVRIEDLKEFASGLDHSEGICLAPNGNVYVGGEAGQIYEIGSDRVPRVVVTTNGFSLGLASDVDNRIYVCDHVTHCVWRMNEDYSLTIFTNGNGKSSMRVPNWGCFDKSGNYFVSDSGGWGKFDGLIWKISNGTAEQWCLEAKNFPNGMAFSKNCKSLYVLESYPPALVEIEILSSGAAGAIRVIAELPGTVPNGVAVTTDGRFIVACYRPDVVYIVSDGGSIEVLAEDPKGTAISAPTNVAFVGDKLERMLVPNLGRWHITEFVYGGIAGIPLNYPTKDQIGS